jgi:hypothetical protein
MVKNAASRLYPSGVSPDHPRSSQRAYAEDERGAGASESTGGLLPFGAGASESRAVFFLSVGRCAT